MKHKKIVINLDKRPDRYKTFLETYTLGDAERFSGIEGQEKINSGDLTNFEQNFLEKLRNFGKNPPKQIPGVFGCWMSHYYVWETLKNDSENDFYVIFEDDIRITEGFNEKIQEITENIDFSFDLYYLGGRFKPNFVPNNKNPWKKFWVGKQEVYYSTNKTVLDYDHDRGLFSYVITKPAAQKMVSLLNSYLIQFEGIAAVDGWINENRSLISTADIFPHITWSPANHNSDIR